MKIKFKKILIMCLCLVMISGLTACGGDGDGKPEMEDIANLNGKTFAMVGKDVSNPYMQKMFEGFEKAGLKQYTEARIWQHPKSRLNL